MGLINIAISFILALLGAILGALGGASNSNKNYRRLGIPILLTIVALIVFKHVLVLSILSLIAILATGYGIPNETDSGSPLGRFYYRLCNNNETIASIWTRGTIGIGIALCLLSILILSSNCILYSIISLIIILVSAFLSWRNLNSIIIFNKSLAVVELVYYFIITFLVNLLILTR